MKRILTSFGALTLLALFSASALAGGDAWLTDYQAALEKAKKENRPVLLEFTGSDWCPPCMQLQKQTFSTSQFEKFANDNLILVKLDFPRQKSQPAEVKQQNEKLAKQYSVEGFPTLVLLNPAGKEITRHVGFLPGGPDSFIAWVKAAK